MRITFTNEPKLSEHAADTSFNERRIALAAQVENYVLKNDRFKDKDVTVTYAHKGVSSLISIIETESEKAVLKIPLSTDYAEGEAQFLRVWEQAGVSVPHIHEEGTIDGHTYILMEFINAPILMDTYTKEEWVSQGISAEMGRTLRRMHVPKAEGFGRVIDGKAEFTHFQEWLLGSDIEERIDHVKERELLTEEHGSIDTARTILLAHVGERTTSSYCHDDFGTGNIFATDPLTVFDPNPRFNDPFIDLGRSVLISISRGLSPMQFIKGYFEGGAYDERVLHSTILLTTYMKFPYWNKTNKQDQMHRVKEYLLHHSHVLDG